MSDASQKPEPVADRPRPPHEYVVVARRYRPQTFDELIGQEHVARALSNAITTNRVGHAYLFTGARGVGKTSAARILAKALNCQQGMQPVPCNQCDMCQAVSGGDDVDVLEIDGASNRGIDEIRQLRQNANVRPSRARFKIYIIDEVHMLTREAFNALLKTLEEPPEHVKFIFCTTEPSKIPITILSRCQRFDFAGIQATSIRERLRQIVEAEGVAAEPEALEVLARRAAGSMRDGQSLLEQLLAFAPERIALADVHGMLGTAGDERLSALVRHLVDRNAAAALDDLDAALAEGVDTGLLLEQLFGYFRDCMAAAVGCPAETFLYASPASREAVFDAGKSLGLETILAVMQILDQTLSRMRYSTQGRVLAELALVRVCCLEDLELLPTLIAQLQAGTSGTPAARPSAAPGATGGSGRPPGPPGLAHQAGQTPGGPKKKAGPAGLTRPGDGLPAAETAPQADESSNPAAEAVAQVVLSPENAMDVWVQALGRMSGLAVEHARQFDGVAISAPNRLVIHLKAGYTLAKSVCERPDQLARFEKALAEVTGRLVRVEFTLAPEETAPEGTDDRTRHVSPQQRLMEIVQRPIMRRASDLFGVQPIRVDPPETQQDKNDA
jgi:DNA polymerase-3 subunit gamma/tau